jgi:uncharacterized protein with HEPN domain
VSRDWRLYWDDILIACRKILRFTAGLDKAGFRSDERTYDAVLRNREVIGEAVKNLPEDARNRAPAIEWKKIAGLRDIIAHFAEIDLGRILAGSSLRIGSDKGVSVP